MFVFIKFLFE